MRVRGVRGVLRLPAAAASLRGTAHCALAVRQRAFSAGLGVGEQSDASAAIEDPLARIVDATVRLESFCARLGGMRDAVTKDVVLQSSQKVTMKDIVLHSRCAAPAPPSPAPAAAARPYICRNHATSDPTEVSVHKTKSRRPMRGPPLAHVAPSHQRRRCSGISQRGGGGGPGPGAHLRCMVT